MAITIPTYDDVEEQGLAFARNRFPGRDTHTESFLGKLVRAVARQVTYFFVSVQSADNDSVPNTKTSTGRLDDMAVAYGIPADTLGDYGRKGATAATGGVAPCTGTNGTIFPDAALLTAPDGVTQVKLSGSVTISGTPPGTGSVSGSFVAVTTGTAGNLPIGTVLTWQSPPSGADSTVTLSTALAGAVDSETDSTLLARILTRLQAPPKGGTASDYRAWAESVSGVYRAYVYPLRSGLGTTDVVITASGSGTGRKPSSAVQTAVDDYINGTSTTEGVRPVTAAGYSTLLPYTAASGLAIRMRMTPSLAKYDFDWSLGATTFTVASYSSGVITANEALPASLTAAIDAYKNGTGAAPRLQVVSTGIAVNPQVEAIDYNSGAKTLTLQTTLPTDWTAPSASDAIYPGGPGVDTAAAALLAYVDGLGPSRAGGYASTVDNWEDTCAIYRLGQVTLDAADTDGIKFFKNVTAATINGSAADVEATDTTANGIELLYAKSIAVTD